MKKEQEKFLNELVASYGVHYIKLHQHHWFVEGPHFFSLHEKFEEIYDETTANLDEVAERMLMIGGKPVSTLAEFLEYSFIDEKKYTQTKAMDMVKEVITDLKKFVSKIVDEGYDLFEGDEVTTDLLVGLNEQHDKLIWMLEATTK